MWKNWIIVKRHPLQACFEVLVPVLACCFIIFARHFVKVTYYEETFKFHPFEPNFIGNSILNLVQGHLSLAYSPENPFLQKLVENVARENNLTLVVAKSNSEELEKYSISFSPFASIEFDDSLEVITLFSFDKLVCIQNRRILKNQKLSDMGFI